MIEKLYLKEKIEQFEGEDVSHFYKDSSNELFSFFFLSLTVRCLSFEDACISSREAVHHPKPPGEENIL